MKFSSRLPHSDCCPCVSLSHVLLVLVILRSTNCDSLMEFGQSLTFAFLVWTLQKLHQTSKPQMFRNITARPFEEQVFLANSSRLYFIDNFYDALLEHLLVLNDGADAVCPNSFLRRGQVIFGLACSDFP